jgi:hypothetical protein
MRRIVVAFLAIALLTGGPAATGEEKKPVKNEDPCQLQEPAGDHLVVVGPNPDQLSKPKVKLSKRQDHRLAWQAKEKGRLLLILIHKPKTGPTAAPFENLIDIGPGFWAVPCSGEICNPGSINKELPKASLCYSYKYDQLLAISGGKTLRADGLIIIEP